MIIENLDALKTWLSETLEPICDADPSALAKYVVALVKKDKTEKELKALCIDQLDVFLQKGNNENFTLHPSLHSKCHSDQKIVSKRYIAIQNHKAHSSLHIKTRWEAEGNLTLTRTGKEFVDNSDVLQALLLRGNLVGKI